MTPPTPFFLSLPLSASLVSPPPLFPLVTLAFSLQPSYCSNNTPQRALFASQQERRTAVALWTPRISHYHHHHLCSTKCVTSKALQCVWQQSGSFSSKGSSVVLLRSLNMKSDAMSKGWIWMSYMETVMPFWWSLEIRVRVCCAVHT